MWQQILDALVVEERKRQETPSLLAEDSQSVKTINFVSLDTNIDGAKRINGRKRHLAVDTLGLPWAMWVTSASVSDSAGRWREASAGLTSGDDSPRIMRKQ